MIPPAWKSVLERVASRRSSPTLMPLALSATVQLANRGRVTAGRVDLAEFERTFAELAAVHAPDKAKQGWQPFYHLSGKTGLWTLWKGNTAASFSDMNKKRPSSAAALRTRVDYARLREDLARELDRAETRAFLTQQLDLMLAPIPG
jgi:hypothetical protein